MKKTIYFICFSLLGLGSISCQKENMTAELKISREPIVFGAQTPQTKGQPQINALSELALQDFGVSAWYSPDGEAFENGSPIHFLANHRFGTMDAYTDASAASTWQGLSRTGEEKSPDPVYYPLDGSLSFFCHAPYRDTSEFKDIIMENDPAENITSRLDNYLPGSPLIRFTPEKLVSNQIDFVAAKPTLNWKKGQGKVPLDFTQHLTTSLIFKCNYVGSLNNEKIIITNIQIRNVIGSEYLYFTKEGDVLGHKWCNNISPEDGSAAMPTASYVLSNEDGSLSREAYLSPATAENNYQQINPYPNGIMYVLPQTFPNNGEDFNREKHPNIAVTYEIRNSLDKKVEENTLEYDLRGTQDWLIGKPIAYNITIVVAVRKELIVNSVVLTDWVDAQNQHDPEEILY